MMRIEWVGGPWDGGEIAVPDGTEEMLQEREAEVEWREETYPVLRRADGRYVAVWHEEGRG